MVLALIALVDLPEERGKAEGLYKKYNDLMYTTAYKILKNHEDAEDAVFYAWEKIICHMDKLSDIDCPAAKSFVIIVTERTAIDLYRKRRRRREVEVPIAECESSPYFITKDQRLEEVEFFDIFRSLAKKYSEVMILYYINQFTAREIAELLGLSEAAVLQRLHRGRRRLRREMETYGRK